MAYNVVTTTTAAIGNLEMPTQVLKSKPLPLLARIHLCFRLPELDYIDIDFSSSSFWLELRLSAEARGQHWTENIERAKLTNCASRSRTSAKIRRPVE